MHKYIIFIEFKSKADLTLYKIGLNFDIRCMDMRYKYK